MYSELINYWDDLVETWRIGSLYFKKKDAGRNQQDYFVCFQSIFTIFNPYLKPISLPLPFQSLIFLKKKKRTILNSDVCFKTLKNKSSCVILSDSWDGVGTGPSLLFSFWSGPPVNSWSSAPSHQLYPVTSILFRPEDGTIFHRCWFQQGHYGLCKANVPSDLSSDEGRG